MCWLGFQPALWCGVCGMGAWVRAIGRASFLCVVLLCFCPFRAQDWRRASLPGCRFACPGLCAGWAFSPPCGAGFAGWGHGCGLLGVRLFCVSFCYAFALSGRRIGGVRLSQGVASLALGYVLVGLSARFVVRGLRDGAWMRASDVRISRVVALLCFCPFRAQDWRCASFSGCRFASPRLCAGWAFSPPCGAGFAGLGHRCGLLGVRLSQGLASLALGYVLVGLSARLVVRGLRDGGMGAGYWACVFSVCRFVMLLPFQGAGLAACVSPRVSLRLPWAMCWLGFQPALWCGACGIGAWVRASDVQRKILPTRRKARAGRIVVSVSPSVGRRAYLPIIFSVRVVPSASVTRTSTACGAERDAALYSAVCAPPTRSVPPTCLPSAV